MYVAGEYLSTVPSEMPSTCDPDCSSQFNQENQPKPELPVQKPSESAWSELHNWAVATEWLALEVGSLWFVPLHRRIHISFLWKIIILCSSALCLCHRYSQYCLGLQCLLLPVSLRTCKAFMMKRGEPDFLLFPCCFPPVPAAEAQQGEGVA